MRRLGWAWKCYILYMLYVIPVLRAHTCRDIYMHRYMPSALHVTYQRVCVSLWYMHIDFCKHSNVQKIAIKQFSH